MKILKNFDKELEDMVEIDTLRASIVPGASNTFRVIKGPWTMAPDPFRALWYDPVQKANCEILVFGEPVKGNKYVMLSAYVEEKVFLYVFERKQYHTMEV